MRTLSAEHRPVIAFSTREEKVQFAGVSWSDDVPGIRARAVVMEDRRWAIVEYASGARREEWCLDGHAGLVLSGSIEFESATVGPR
jgi:hypothetical protein